jgi:protein-disulfide isomerase
MNSVCKIGTSLIASLVCLSPAAAETRQLPSRPAAASEARLSTAQIEQIVRQYLLDHPEVLLESVQRYQQRDQAQQREQKREAVGKLQNELYQDAASPTLERGAQEGEPVSVVAFLDYQCGYCKRSADTLTKVASMPGVRIIFKDFPILGPDSLRAAKAALAAGKQNAYQPFHEALMKSSGPLTPTRLDEIVAELKLDAARFKTDLETPEIASAIDRNRKLAGKLGVQSTPTFVIGNEVVPGALTEEAFHSLIEAARNQQRIASAKPPAKSR